MVLAEIKVTPQLSYPCISALAEKMKSLFAVIVLLGSLLPANAGWLPREIQDIRAYVYDYTQEKGNSMLLKDARLHKGVINVGGTKLSDNQVKRLKNAMRSSKDECLEHSVTTIMGLYSTTRRAERWGISNCAFSAGMLIVHRRELSKVEWDWKVMRKLLEELKIPILKKDCRLHQAIH